MAATYEPIYTTTLGSTQSSLTFSSFGGYTDLRLIISAKTASSSAQIYGTINGDGGANYSRTILWGNGSAKNSNRDANASSWNLDYYGVVSSTFYNTNITDFMNYTNTNTYKSIITRTSNVSEGLEIQAALWRNSAAITTFTLNVGGGGFAAGSTFTLYGIKAA
jgi:hypothetical protein